MTTPTPGDLSARLPELPDHDVKGVHFDGYSAAQMHAYAIAALSAPPHAPAEAVAEIVEAAERDGACLTHCNADDPRDEEYRAHSGGASVAIVIIIFAIVYTLGGFQ